MIPPKEYRDHADYVVVCHDINYEGELQVWNFFAGLWSCNMPEECAPPKGDRPIIQNWMFYALGFEVLSEL